MIYGLSKDEVCLICDALNGTIVDRHRGFLLMEVNDAIRLNGLDKKWVVNRSTIQAKLEALEERQVQIFLERVSKFWKHTEIPTDEALHLAELDAPTSYLINSAVIATGGFGRYDYTESSAQELELFIQKQDPVSRIGYPDTARLIEDIAGHYPRVSRALSTLEAGEQAMVVRLKYRMQEPGQKGRPTQAVRREDFEIGLLERVK